MVEEGLQDSMMIGGRMLIGGLSREGKNSLISSCWFFCLNKGATKSEGQMVYGEKKGSDSFAVEFNLPREFNDGLSAVFYFVDYSARYHSSLHDDIELLSSGFSIRFSFYLTAGMATWAAHIRSLEKKERIKVMRDIFFNEKNTEEEQRWEEE